MSEILRATLQSIRYRKPDSLWTIAKTNKGITKGVIPWEPAEGDLLEMEGTWKRSDFNGDNEFAFFACRLTIPEDSKSLLYYAVSLTKGLGDSAFEKIWEQYGDQWQTALPLNVKGISKSVDFHWQETLKNIKDKQAQTDTISFLISHGASLNMANLAWDKWKENTYSVVTKNCYALADLPNYGFRAVDEGIRQNFGIADNDQRRIDSALMYAVNQKLDGGDTLVNYPELVEEFQKIIPDCVGRLDEAVKNMLEAGKIKIWNIDDVSLSIDAEHEEKIWERWK